MPAKIVVGYRTRTVEPKLLETLLPEFKAAKNLKDQAKIAADIEARKEKFLATAKDQPYTGTFDAVCLVDLATMERGTWSYESRKPGTNKAPVCVAVANWILARYPGAWGRDTHDTGNGSNGKPAVIFLGFAPRGFLKMLGEECSLPENHGGTSLVPLRMWYTNSDHRCIGEAIVPTGYDIPYETALRRRVPTDPAAAAAWKEKYRSWKEPHVDPELDVDLAIELAAQLGMLNGD